MNITQAPSGINMVIETDASIYIGRLGRLFDDKVQMHHAAVFSMASDNPEALIRRAARYGVPVEHEELVFDARNIRRVRKLGEVPKC